MTHQEKWQHLVHRIHKAQMVAIVAGHEPTEAWLGPEEMETAQKQSDISLRFTSPMDNQKEILGLRVMESKGDSIRVGTTFSPPTS